MLFAESDAVALAGMLSSVLTTVIVTAGGVATAYLAWKVAKLGAQAKINTAAIAEVHRATNSITEQLVAKTESEALARGGVEERERAEERVRAERADERLRLERPEGGP